MAWLQSASQYKPGWLQKLAMEVIKSGPIPTHVAIILDGNRRFARKAKLGNVLEGHKLGANKVGDVVEILISLGVKELTVYAFSIENFKRAKEEVDGIMNLLEENLVLSDGNVAKAKEKGVCVEILGDLTKARSPDLKGKLEKGMWLSRENSKLKVNIAFIYTGRNEVTSGVNCLLQGLSRGEIEVNEVNQEVLEGLFTLHPSSPVDILIRTSGESRLSDFLLWGCSEAYLEFVGVTWPEFNFWRLFGIIVRFQNQVLHNKIQGHINRAQGKREHRFVDDLRSGRWSKLEQAYLQNEHCIPSRTFGN